MLSKHESTYVYVHKWCMPLRNYIARVHLMPNARYISLFLVAPPPAAVCARNFSARSLLKTFFFPSLPAHVSASVCVTLVSAVLRCSRERATLSHVTRGWPIDRARGPFFVRSRTKDRRSAYNFREIYLRYSSEDIRRAERGKVFNWAG